MKCKELATQLVCFYNATSDLRTTLVAHYEYGVDASGGTILVATRYTDAEGTVIDTAGVGNSVAAGACSVPPADVEWVKLCDLQADGSVVEFICRTITTFDGNGDVIVPVAVANFELDKVTAYTPTGTVVACNEDCDAVTALGLLNAWG